MIWVNFTVKTTESLHLVACYSHILEQYLGLEKMRANVYT